MKKLFVYLFFSLALILSCDKKELESGGLDLEVVENEFNGMVFKDWDEFSAYHGELARLDENLILEKISDNGYTSFLEIALNSENETELEAADFLIPSLMAVMNADYEFMVNDTIVSYSQENFYEMSKEDTEPRLSDKIKIAVFDENGWKQKNSLTSRIVLGSGSAAGVSTLDFFRQEYRSCQTNQQILGPSSKKMRYHQQLKAVLVSSTAFLFVETRLYWRNSSNTLRLTEWEERTYDYNLSGYVEIERFGPSGVDVIGGPININTTTSCSKLNPTRLLVVDVFPATTGTWTVDLSGTITHRINGDSSSNIWNAPVNW